MAKIEVTYIDHMGSDLTVANAARVSFGKKSELDTSDVWGPPTLKEKDAKLINYLADHDHISPFGHCFASFHVKAPIFVARQLVKHKFLRWNEISRRYVDDEPEFYVPEVWRGRAENVKQGSAGEVKLPYLVPHEFNRSALYEYETLLEAGVAPEQARMVLPQSTMTEWYWSGSLDAFADMCDLRCTTNTQTETREVAQRINSEMELLFPVSWVSLMGSLEWIG
jgi:thymidylate synthase (FAD)